MPAKSNALISPADASGIMLSERVLKLKSPDRMAREEAVSELAAKPDLKTAYELCMLLADPDISVRNLASEVLVKMGSAISPVLINEALSNDHDVRKFVVDIMALVKDPEFVPVLIRLLDDANENVVGSSAEALGKVISVDAVEPLTKCISRYPDCAAQAIEALGNIGSAEALPVLTGFLGSDNLLLAYAAVEAIGKINSPRAIDILLAHFKDGNKQFRNVLLMTIIKMTGSGNREKIFKVTEGKLNDYLIEASASDDLDVKKAAIAELAFWNGPNTVKALIEALGDDDIEIVNLARGALIVAAESGLNVFIESMKSCGDQVRSHLIEISSFFQSPEMLDAILASADSANPDIRLGVAKALNKYADGESIRVLLSLADDQIGHIRAQALQSLGLVADESIAEDIWHHFDDEYPDVREACLGAVILIGGSRAIKMFEDDIKSPNIDRRVLAIRGLSWIGEDRAIQILINALHHEDAEVRRNAIIGLTKMKYSGLGDKLPLLLADENPGVRMAVIDACVGLSGYEAADKIKVMLSDQDMLVRFYAVNALALLKDNSCLEELIKIMENQPPFVQIAIINAIAKYGNQKAADELSRLTGSENEDIANAAREALDSRQSQ